ncbi:uncharacterized protein LOC102360351 [Latimeria chalumnae]|uniref:uncharacterized protein LOC102360351 n=1 Tax=Latimeria chalumnae TaxID=7897 RepID=UPI0003C1342A|nr:PREDICTED: uncharacterized protein LOC102360351 [Latimeria chalumnae]|eukprot:XP_005987994.1 PREDICTED: uncharacterized protein LOC102360351 [Latimeria chalumnae]
MYSVPCIPPYKRMRDTDFVTEGDTCFATCSSTKPKTYSLIRKQHSFPTSKSNSFYNKGAQYSAKHKKEQISFRTTSDRLGHWKLGSWWKQALETGRRASTGLLPVLETSSSTMQDKKSISPAGKAQHGAKVHNIFSQPSPRTRTERADEKWSHKEKSVLKKAADVVTVHRTEKKQGPSTFPQVHSKTKVCDYRNEFLGGLLTPDSSRR